MDKPAPSYPIHLSLKRRLCVVVGAGPTAERKVSGLLESGARVRVVAPEATSALRKRAEQGEIELRLAPYRTEDLEDALLVFAATDRREINALVTADAVRLGALVNAADAPEEGDFITPAVVRRGDLCFSVSTGGSQPMLAARIAAELEAHYGPEIAAWVDLLGRMRSEIKQRFEDAASRREAMTALLGAEVELRRRLDRGEASEAEALARSILEQGRREKGERET